MVDALAITGEEGRGSLRKATKLQLAIDRTIVTGKQIGRAHV